MKALEIQDLMELLKRAIKDERGFGDMEVDISEDMLEMIAIFAGGNARNALSTLEMVIINGEQVEVKDEDGGEGTKKNKVIVSKEIIEACISKSMTPEERSNPAIINTSRKNRIAKGSGRNISEVNQLLKQFDQMSKMKIGRAHV